MGRPPLRRRTLNFGALYAEAQTTSTAKHKARQRLIFINSHTKSTLLTQLARRYYCFKLHTQLRLSARNAARKNGCFAHAKTREEKKK
jgi:hypothetical protein